MDTILSRKKNIFKYQDIIAFFCFLAIVVFLCWKSKYGFGFDEDSFYIAVPYRLTMGDSLITDEWHLSQLVGFLLYWPVKLFVSVSGSTEGIVLYFRYLFIVFQGTISIAIYYRLRKYGLFAIFAASIFYLNISYTIMTLSYNTMGVGFIELTGLFMATLKKDRKTTLFLVGLFMACAVLCSPILAIVYLLYSVCVILYETTKGKKHIHINFSKLHFSAKSWFWITLGILSVAVIFFIFLFSRATLHEIITNFPYLFKDADYIISSKDGNSQNVISIFKSIFGLIKLNPYLSIAYILLMIVIIFDKKRIPHRRFYLLTVSVIFSLFVAFIMISSDINIYVHNMFPVAFLGLTCYMLSEKKEKNLLVFIWILGALYAVCIDVTSDMGSPSLCIGLSVSSVASVIFIKNLMDELRNESQVVNKSIYSQNKEHKLKVTTTIVSSVLVATMLLQIFQEIFIEIDFNSILSTEYSADEYFGTPKGAIDYTIQTGPEKGLKTTSAMGKKYKDILRDLSYIKERNDGAVFVIECLPWCYLYLEMPLATYTPVPNNTYEVDYARLLKYYELHPEKTPRYIYIAKVSAVTKYYYYPEKAKKELEKVKQNIITPNNFNYTVKESNAGYLIEIKK